MKIVLVDDHSLIRDLFRVWAGDLSHDVLGEADCGSEAVGIILNRRPDLVILDIKLPDFDGFKVIEIVRQAGATCRILLMSGFCDDRTVYLVERARVQGFVYKPSCSSRTLQLALVALSEGRTYFSATFCETQKSRRSDPIAFDKVLSDAEQRMLGLLGKLLTDEEIAAELRISTTTVEKHRFHIRQKLGLPSKTELLRYIRDHGFLESPVGSYRKPV